MNEFYNHHYIRTDASGNIVEGWSDGPHRGREVTEDDILISDKGGYQFRLLVNLGFRGDAELPTLAETEENPPLYTFDGIPLYSLNGNTTLPRTVSPRTEDEIEADRAEKRKEQEKEALKPTQLDRIESQITYTALMTDTLMSADAAIV